MQSFHRSHLRLRVQIAVNKQKNEERIEETLLILQSEYSRIGIIQEIHMRDTMRRYIMDAYRLGIEFSRAATLYYARSTFRRILEAVTKPPQLGIEVQKTAITEAVTQIEKERDTLNAKRLYEVQLKMFNGVWKALKMGLRVLSAMT